MCNFFSCIVTKPANVLWNKDTDSHEELISEFKLNDNQVKRTWARVEVVPKNGDLISTLKKSRFNDKDWVVRVDEVSGIKNTEQVEWWSDKHEKAAMSALKMCIKEVVLNPKKDIEVNSGRYIAIGGSGVVKAYDSSTVEAWGKTTVEAHSNSTVEAYDRSTVEACDNATVEAWDKTTVEAYDNATVIIEQYSSFSTEKLKLSDNSHCINHRDKEVIYSNEYNYRKI